MKLQIRSQILLSRLTNKTNSNYSDSHVENFSVHFSAQISVQHNLTILVFKGSERVQNLVLLLLLPLWAPKVARERFNKRLESQEWLRCPLDYWIGMVWLGGHFNIVGFFFTGFMNLDSPIIRTGCNLCGVRVSESP